MIGKPGRHPNLAMPAVEVGTFKPLGLCICHPTGNGEDDVPATLDAFRQCGHGGRVAFLNETYHIESVMNTTGLDNCEIDLRGTLLWGININYWLQNSYPIEYQNQSSAFLGHGYGTLNGNGQTWYDYSGNTSNLIGRPHVLTLWDTKDSVVEGLRFLQPPMWTTTIMHSKNVVLQDIYINATSNSYNKTGNTDGATTFYSDNITFRRFTVDDGDDCIVTKVNSTNILIEDSKFHNGHGVAIGSIGQFADRYERIENITVQNINFYKTGKAIYLKTWTGQRKGIPPNGSGGRGFLRNATLHNSRSIFAIDQCISYIGAMDGCETSEFQLFDIHFDSVRGTARTAGVFQCSGVAPCMNVSLTHIDVRDKDGNAFEGYQCENLEDAKGISCIGPPTWNYIKYVRNHEGED
ncbi:glycoside hydrolase family 28 protein [Mucidula mucida]|nr:glycoside hydrolase family 28 protein [Mucidula mucida]